MVDYQDDLTVYSKLRERHIKHLRQVFERCRIYGISLNPKKVFVFHNKGKLLGHVVSKEGVYIDPERVKEINDLNPPTSRKGVQYFFGKINFVRRFVPDYATIVKPINKLLKKDKKFEWTPDIQKSFTEIKHAITTALVLVSPDFDKEFILYSFSSDETIASILTQKNQKLEELPISFMSKTLHDYELNYSIIEKQALSLVKAISHFRTYILSTHIIAYVPHSPVKMLLNQQLREGRWENWLEKLQEYDLEIKPLKVVKGQGLCKFMTGIEAVNISPPNGFDVVIQGTSLENSEWYKDIIFYLKSGHSLLKCLLKKEEL
jgi:hypothetical protein